MALIPVESGPNGDVFYFARSNNRVPARDFLDELPRPLRRKFEGQFHQVCIEGAKYANPQRFKPLHGPGKGLWEFKSFDARVYCVREQVTITFVKVVLLCGWCKDKEGRSLQEDHEITRANHFRAEFTAAA